MENTAKFCHLTIDQITKNAYVWHEANWQFYNDFHSHRMGQLIYVEKGFQYLYIDKNRYLLPPSYCAYIPPGLVHKTDSPLEKVFLRTLYFFIDSEEPFYKEQHIFYPPRVLKEMILYTERYSRKIDYDPVESAFLHTIWKALPEFTQDSKNLILPLPSDIRLVKVIQQISDKLAEEVNMQQLIRNNGFSQRTFQRLFKNETGMTFATYIRLMRMIKAIELLSVSQENISEIAFRVGYNSLPTFSATFKQTIGITPHQIKQMFI